MLDDLWNAEQQSERLRTRRSDGRSVWQDSAARDISSRWLDPHDDLAKRLVSDSRSQTEAMDQARAAQREADAQAQVAATRAADTVGWLNRLDESARAAMAASSRAIDVAGHATHTAAEADAEADAARRILSTVP